MMRELRFRAWNATTRRMVDLNAVTPLALDPAFNGQLDGVFVPFKEGYKIMQFTGLNDRNGVPIFEGDILSGGMGKGAGYSKSPDKPCLFEVKYGDMGFGDAPLLRQITELTGDYRGYPSPMSCEVIGNIYEHSNLLAIDPHC